MRLLPYLQAPAGNVTPPLRPVSTGDGFGGLENWRPAWFASGTAALAAAVRVAVNVASSDALPAAATGATDSRPRVLLAAYGCPDLVAAIRYAGAEAVFVDVERDGFRIDVEAARDALQTIDSIVALIGVDLFGCSEDWTSLVDLCREFRIICVRDSAQSLQSREDIDNGHNVDCQVFSFGRGKPLYLQGGGALLIPRRAADTAFTEELSRSQARWTIAGDRHLRARQWLYNRLLNPYLYALAAKILGSRLGRTEYHDLEEIERAPARFSEIADAAISDYWGLRADRTDAVIDRLTRLRAAFPELLSRVQTADSADSVRLNRLPIVLSGRALRDRCVAELRSNGISATQMYGRVLPEITGVEGVVSESGIENARSLAGRLLTVPVHARLTDADLDVVERTLRVGLDSMSRHDPG